MKLKFLLPVLLLFLTACAATPPAVKAADASFSNGGLTLSVPREYAALLLVQTPEDGGALGTLFSVHEKASADAAAALLPGDRVNGGSLFAIHRVSRSELSGILDADIPGMVLFARDGEGNYYLCSRPTDVQLIRTGEVTDTDRAQWSALFNWAEQAQARLLADNPDLIPCSHP